MRELIPTTALAYRVYTQSTRQGCPVVFCSAIYSTSSWCHYLGTSGKAERIQGAHQEEVSEALLEAYVCRQIHLCLQRCSRTMRITSMFGG